MKILNAYSGAGSVNNEDLIWYNEHCAVVLDGATGLTGTASRASRFVGDFIAFFSAALERGEDLCASVNAAIEGLQDVYAAMPDTAAEVPPSAAGIFLYETERELQILKVGDCSALLFSSTGIRGLCSDKLDEFDDQVINRMKAIRAHTGANICDILQTEEIRGMLLSNRKKMNRKDGYRIFSVNMQKVKESDIMIFDRAEIEHVVLYSDGFQGMKDSFLNYDWNFEALYEKLRLDEQKDRSLNANPRFKISDDASAIAIAIK